MAETRTAKPAGERRTLVQGLVEDLRHLILKGEIEVGNKLPSEAALTTRYSVSRTVVREAIAALRSEGLVEPRQGAGVFVSSTQSSQETPLTAVDADKLSSLVEMMEFRVAVESEAAALAAARRSPAQEMAIMEALEELDRGAAAGVPTGHLDFAFHIAIARATNNPRFEQFLEMLGHKAIPRARIGPSSGADASAAYYAQLREEHHRIAAAISDGDESAARDAARAHLEGALRRYRRLRQSAVN